MFSCNKTQVPHIMEVEDTEKMPQTDPEHLIIPYFLLLRFRTHPHAYRNLDI